MSGEGDKHKNATTWGPGQSGNPGGRSPRVGPNGETLVELCRAKTLDLVTRAIDIATATATEPDTALRAIFGLLDRGWGKPKESIDLAADIKGGLVTRIELVAVRPDDRRED